MIKKLDRSCLDMQSTTVYDFNELTLQELLSKFFEKINNCIDVSNQALTFLEWLKQEGLPIEVQKEIEKMYLDGRLTEIINKLADNVNEKVDNVLLYQSDKPLSEYNKVWVEDISEETVGDLVYLDKEIDRVTNKIEEIDNNVSNKLNTFSSQLEQKASKVDVAKISSGTPLFASNISEMIDTTKNYVNISDGYLYSYNSGSWVNTNVLYQSKGIDDKSITPIKTSFFDITESQNKCDETKVIAGYKLGDDGNLIVEVTQSTTDFIEIPLGFSYILTQSRNVGTGIDEIASRVVCQYDKDKTMIKRTAGSLATAIPIESNAKFVRVSYYTSRKNYFVGFNNTGNLMNYDSYFKNEKIKEENLPDNFVKKEEIPTKLSELENDLGFITEVESGQTDLEFPNRKKITITGTGKIENDYILKLNVHRGNPIGDIVGTDLFLNNGCKTDFSDIRFTDKNGKIYPHYIENRGNYELIYDDNNVGKDNFIFNGNLYSSRIPGKEQGVYKSFDNGQSWQPLLTGSKSFLVYVDTNGYLYANYGNDRGLLKRSVDDGKTWTTVLDTTSTGSYVKQKNIVEDNDGNLYAGLYQLEFNVKIYKSTDKGETWNLIHTEPSQFQHVHGIWYDKFNDVLYAGLDGGGKNKKIIKSVNKGVTWSDIFVGWGGDISACFIPNKNVRFFMGGNATQGKVIWKTTDDINFQSICNNSISIQDAEMIGNKIYFTGTTKFGNIYPQILRMNDDGRNIETIWSGDYNLGEFRGYYTTHLGSPTGYERQIFLGKDESTSDTTFRNSRLYVGGNHYQATFHIKIDNIQPEGIDLYIKYGNSSAQDNSSIDIYNKKGIEIDDTIIHLPLDEGVGTTIKNVSSKGSLYNATLVHTNGLGNWDIITPSMRVGNNIPYNSYSNISYYFNGDYITLPTIPELETISDTGITLLAWVKLNAEKVPQTIISKGGGNNVFALRIGSDGYYVPTLQYSDGIENKGLASSEGGMLNNGDFMLIMASVGTYIPGVTKPEIRVGCNGRISSTLTIPSDKNFVYPTGEWRIGKDTGSNGYAFDGNICGVQIIKKAITQLEFLQIYENRKRALDEPKILTTLT